ncbi:translation initiation factor IF-2 [Persicirhabdus sediminis]|uniref:Translation initiation factor IF-2 n=1 Tax=Persicirhabdus sediminis TaxID=454144 RepID=A0A8J7MFK3_9BACT|nr:translation initiation factor IF-2 [Persicirhabdus sediminis]MBK1791836.1 translation initiation factor IF-2 [Persicirhabdus sediminis]
MADNSDSNEKKKKVLDLLSDEAPKKKLSRRERQREEAEAVKSLDDQKREALDIFEEDGKKKNSGIRKTVRSGKNVVQKISRGNEGTDGADIDMQAKDGSPSASVSAAEAAKEAAVAEGKLISLKPPIVVSTLAEMMDLKPFQLMADLIKLEVFVAPHQAIEPEIAEKLCQQHGFQFEREKREKGGGVHNPKKKVKEPKAKHKEPADKLELRAPIVTIMGHVDHGKTTLLDCVRNARVAASEAGGITQHIGAYRVEHNGRPITFIDTPGHAIFTDMRARGADVTDIVVIVVAANDGLMPQTKEAIEHARKAGKTMIVAVNKCDVEGADPVRVRTQLMEFGVNPVDFGGDVECCDVSALTGDGMDDLLELIALQAEVLELKANPNANARAHIIEARVQAGKGATASVIVEAGTLKAGMPFICGPYSGKVKSMLDEWGKPLKVAGPATPVEVIGFCELPNVGDEMVEMKNERAAKKLSEERQLELRQSRLARPKRSRMEDMLSFVSEGDAVPCLNIVLKTDVQGSVQAIQQAIGQIESNKVDAKFIHAAAGAITESDIQRASSSDGVVIGFNTKVEANAVRAAKSEGVQIKLFSVIYELIDTVRESLLGLLEPETREAIMGHAEVKQVFKVRRGRAAGCIITDGKVNRKAHARVLRKGTPVFDGKMSTLRRHLDEVEEVKVGIECGIRLGDFDEYEEGDVIECYNLEKVDQTL